MYSWLGSASSADSPSPNDHPCDTKNSLAVDENATCRGAHPAVLSAEIAGIGDYTVALTGYNQAGSKQDSATIHVLNPPIAGLSADVTSGTSPLTVNFTANCTGDIDNYDWDFGDGVTSGDENPSHQYSEGTYDVSLIASNPYCSDEIILADYIVVSTPTPTYPRWVSKFDNTFWNATPGNGSWNGSAWVPNSNGFLQLLAIGTWAAGYRPTKIRVTPDRPNPDSGYYCWLRSNLDGYPFLDGYPIIWIGPDGIGNINWGNYNIFGIQRAVLYNLYLTGIEFYEEA